MGAPVLNPPVILDIESDPVLAGTKMIAEAWDAGGRDIRGQACFAPAIALPRKPLIRRCLILDHDRSSLCHTRGFKIHRALAFIAILILGSWVEI